MTNGVSFVRSLWALTVLCFLRERALHPYEILQLVAERKKDQFLDLKRGSLYHAVEQLLRAGMIEAKETVRMGKRPERTVYYLTDAGESETVEWLANLLRTPGSETREFMAALSLMTHLSPIQVARLLEERAAHISKELIDLRESVELLIPAIGRPLLLESEYGIAAMTAELAWVQSIVREIRDRRIRWKPVSTRSSKTKSSYQSRPQS